MSKVNAIYKCYKCNKVFSIEQKYDKKDNESIEEYCDRLHMELFNDNNEFLSHHKSKFHMNEDQDIELFGYFDANNKYIKYIKQKQQEGDNYFESK